MKLGLQRINAFRHYEITKYLISVLIISYRQKQTRMFYILARPKM